MQIDQKLDIHNRNARLEAGKLRLEKSEISKQDKQVILDFVKSISITENLSPGREVKLIDILRMIRIKTAKNFTNLKKKDIENFLLWLNGNQIAQDTKKDYRMLLKRFMRWYWIKLERFQDNGNKYVYPPEVAWVKLPKKESNRNSGFRDVLLEEQDVLKIIDVAKNPMWRAALWILWEGGLRVGELLNLRLRDIETTDFGVRVNIEFGKTGARKLPLVQAKQSLLIWKSLHPRKNDPNELLFPISYNGLSLGVKELAGRAGITGKAVNLHSWRKARATYLSGFMTPYQQMRWFGWSSPTTSTSYVFLSDKDVLPIMLQMNGLSKIEQNGTIVTFKTCIRCNERNDLDKENCLRCGFGLTPEALKKLEQEQQASIEKIVEKQFIEKFSKYSVMLKPLQDHKILEMKSEKDYTEADVLPVIQELRNRGLLNGKE